MKEDEESTLFFQNLQPPSFCRICHEDELQSSNKLESPCACSGTSKFAHRDCIQRWCDEKGNTTCEICLQKYEPGYSAAPRKVEVAGDVLTIRGSIELPQEEDDEEEELLLTEFDCSSTAERSASCCKTIAIILMVLLLVRHLLAAISVEAGSYPFSLPTILLLKSCGIIIPMYIIIQAISGIQNTIRKFNHQQRLRHLHLLRYNRGRADRRRLHITVDIHSH